MNRFNPCDLLVAHLKAFLFLGLGLSFRIRPQISQIGTDFLPLMGDDPLISFLCYLDLQA
jgi:hypothetical protein